MRWVRFACGILLLVSLAGCASFGSGLDEDTAGLEAEGAVFVRESVMAIGRRWDAQELVQRADVQFLKNVPPNQVRRVFRRFSSTLGALRGDHGDVPQRVRILEDGESYLIDYVSDLACEYGTATANVTVARRNRRWGIVNFSLDSKLLKQEAAR